MFFMPSKLNLVSLKINGVGKECSVSFGSSEKINRNIKRKKQQGFGESNADLVSFVVPISYVNDADFLDLASIKNNR